MCAQCTHFLGTFCTVPTRLQIAVLKEVDGKGPFCSLVMAVVVVKDVVVITAYALNMELIHAVSGGAMHVPGLHALTAPAGTPYTHDRTDSAHRAAQCPLPHITHTHIYFLAFACFHF